MKKINYYTIYENSTDEIVASGKLDECAKQLNTNTRCVSSLISRAKHKKRGKYSVVIEKVKDEYDF